jgi:hypothetical protein
VSGALFSRPTGDEPLWLHSHVNEPNPAPPSAETAFVVYYRHDTEIIETRVTLHDLAHLPHTEAAGCMIVSTGHGTSGPFTFGGVRLADLIAAYTPPGLRSPLPDGVIDVISADGFGNRVRTTELDERPGERPILLATAIDGRPMTRAEGLVRLIVPSETRDALRQVKWIARIEIYL